MSKAILSSFYEAFQSLDAKAMGRLYHPEARFSDPVFSDLNHEEVCAMWEMLIERSGGNLKIRFHTIRQKDSVTSCTWEATYLFSKTNRKVHNVIQARMTFKDGLILTHTDHFNFWKWSQKALGTPGLLLGWTPLLRSKVRKMAASSLDRYLEKH